MVVAVALMALGAVGAIALGGLLLASTANGTFEIGSIVAIGPKPVAALAAALAVAATALIAAGASELFRRHRRIAEAIRLDANAMAAEEAARAQLLAMRIEQLQRELEQLEHRRSAAVAADGEARLVVVPESDQSGLRHRLESAARARSLRT